MAGSSQGDEDRELRRYLDHQVTESGAWSSLLAQADGQLKDRQAADTPREILQQPWVWEQSARLVVQQMDMVEDLVRNADEVYLTGAGSSFYVGQSVEYLLRTRLRKPVRSIPSTDLILNPDAHLRSSARGLLVSLSRSGCSPESFEAIRMACDRYPHFQQLLVTCNGEGELVRAFSTTPQVRFVALHPASCDRGLAMTSSFTSMVVCCQMLGFLGAADAFLTHVQRLTRAARRALLQSASLIQALDTGRIRRVCLLADGPLMGVSAEGALKILEMTDGQVCTLSESFLGVRHGPLSFVDDSTLVVYLLSSQETPRRYELDLMAEITDKGLALRRVTLGCNLSGEVLSVAHDSIDFAEPAEGLVADELRAPLDVLFAQVLALRLCLAFGLDPDNPSRRGAISRVVQGVRIHRR